MTEEEEEEGGNELPSFPSPLIATTQKELQEEKERAYREGPCVEQSKADF